WGHDALFDGFYGEEFEFVRIDTGVMEIVLKEGGVGGGVEDEIEKGVCKVWREFFVKKVFG
ncbi:hypothetical protein, partial [Bacillus subtilis]|uniref:hypothetical protein n=1 Tax=Bacillus subtilis TaxID=1423 RepID=UPI001BDBA314